MLHEQNMKKPIGQTTLYLLVFIRLAADYFLNCTKIEHKHKQKSTPVIDPPPIYFITCDLSLVIKQQIKKKFWGFSDERISKYLKSNSSFDQLLKQLFEPYFNAACSSTFSAPTDIVQCAVVKRPCVC